jgi:hypothetical protein
MATYMPPEVVRERVGIPDDELRIVAERVPRFRKLVKERYTWRAMIRLKDAIHTDHAALDVLDELRWGTVIRDRHTWEMVRAAKKTTP